MKNILSFIAVTAACLAVTSLKAETPVTPAAAKQAVKTHIAPAPAISTRDDLKPEEKNVIEIFRRVSPSVVSVANKAIVRSRFNFHLYEIPQGMGTGFVWDKEGHIISNFHVVYEASAIDVTLSDGRSYSASVVGVDPDHDIAVLQIKAPAELLVPIVPGTSGSLLVGQSVMAIGNPFGLDTSLSVGIVSALGRNITSMTDRNIYDVIQTDAAINPGNSGGPLLDSSGRLIGINTAIVSPSGGYAGVGFAVPVDTVKRIVPQLITHGEVKRAGLGIALLPDQLTKQADAEGAAILEVFSRGAAEKAGLKGVKRSGRGRYNLGDVIVGIDSVPVKNNDDFLEIMDRHKEGDKLKVDYMRGDQKLSVEIILKILE